MSEEKNKPTVMMLKPKVYCPHTEDYRMLDGSSCPKNCPMKGALICPMKGD